MLNTVRLLGAVCPPTVPSWFPSFGNRSLHLTLAAITFSAFAQNQLSAQTPPLVFPDSVGIQLKNEDMSTSALDKAEASGVKYVRKAIYWNNIEPAQGSYNWSQPDGWINSMESRGFSMLITLVWNNPIYEDIYERAIVTEPGRQAFANFVADVAARYQGKDIIWEIWNEPNLRSFWHENAEGMSNTDAMAEEYTELVKDAVPAMKAADPNCRIVAGSISALWTDSFNWFDRCIEMGILTSGIDGISVHPYGFRWPELAMLEGYPVIRQKMDQHGAATMPIVTSEVGYPEAWITERGIPLAEVENAQAWMFVRQNLVDAMSDLPLTIWYELTDASYGMLETNLTQRPTFVAAQVLATQLAGYFFKSELQMSSSLDYAAIFENATGQQKLVVWTTPDKTKPLNQRVEVPHTVALPVGVAGTYHVTDTFGAVSTIPTSGSSLSVTIAGGPKYIPLLAPIAVSEHIVDNATAGSVSITGAWTASTSSSGYYGSNYHHDGNAGKGTKSFGFLPNIFSGDYLVYARWEAAANRAASVPIDVTVNALTTATTTVNQRTNGSIWNLLGGHTLDAAYARVTIRTTNTSGYVIADAVRFVPPGSSAMIVDNTNATATNVTGAWTTSTSTSGYYGTNYAHDGNTGKGAKIFRFRPLISATGDYFVYLRWVSGSNRATNVPVDIVSASGAVDTVYVNQQASGGQWVLLGGRRLAPSNAEIRIRTDSTNGFVIADAVKIVAPAAP